MLANRVSSWEAVMSCIFPTTRWRTAGGNDRRKLSFSEAAARESS